MFHPQSTHSNILLYSDYSCLIISPCFIVISMSPFTKLHLIFIWIRTVIAKYNILDLIFFCWMKWNFENERLTFYLHRYHMSLWARESLLVEANRTIKKKLRIKEDFNFKFWTLLIELPFIHLLLVPNPKIQLWIKQTLLKWCFHQISFCSHFNERDASGSGSCWILNAQIELFFAWIK